ncbi:MAG TPA: glycosyltransferase [Candidatus Saccharimonadia bacterium]|nr:glycosyltransferase [Candidatus Saccharimonadia bacterium]
MREPKIALTHHWLTSPGGAEKVLYELHQMYPEAPIYTSAYDPKKFPEFAGADIRTTFLDKIPFLKLKHQLFPIFLGTPFKTLDMSGYDIVISSCAAEAKYVRTSGETLHICYCHTPVRYYWSDYEWRLKNLPFGAFNWLARLVFPVLIGVLRWVDYRAAQGVDVFVANSRHIQRRIAQYYHRDSTVIYPPIVMGAQGVVGSGGRDYYLIVGRQVASKRLDVAVDAFNSLGLPLKVVGAGEEIARQRPRAQANIEFLGRVSDDERDRLFAGAKAFVFPPEEDFGMVPLEAMAVGTPVIAYDGGGAPEYVTDGETGVLFGSQTGAALADAVQRFEGMTFDEGVIRARAKEFDASIFRKTMAKFVRDKWDVFTLNKGTLRP